MSAVPLEYELLNARGDRVRLLGYGARIRSVRLRMDGTQRDVVLGYEALPDYRGDRYYMGCVAGRYCNRIAGARFSIGDREYRLAGNEGLNQIHGGPQGFSFRDWQGQPRRDGRTIDFRLTSADGDQGYPGTLDVTVSYSWNDARELTIRYRARTDGPTYVNLTNHAYFNLDAEKRDVLGHGIRIASEHITPVDEQMIPTGTIADIAGTALDLRRRTRIADVVTSDSRPIAAARGVDLNFVLGAGRPAAELWSSKGDLRMTVDTSYPALQVYSGQQLGAPWRPYAGVCLEAQYFPDSPNQPSFPDTLLLPGTEYDEYVRYRFCEE